MHKDRKLETGCPRETLSVLLCPSSAATPKFQFNGSREATAIHSAKRQTYGLLRFVRNGLEAPYVARFVGFRQHGVPLNTAL
jgi:hypothetical protein